MYIAAGPSLASPPYFVRWRARMVSRLTCWCAVALHVLGPAKAVPGTPAGSVRGSPPFRVPCNGRAGVRAGLHVVELAKTDRNVPANDTVGGGLVFANPVSLNCHAAAAPPPPLRGFPCSRRPHCWQTASDVNDLQQLHSQLANGWICLPLGTR